MFELFNSTFAISRFITQANPTHTILITQFVS